MAGNGVGLLKAPRIYSPVQVDLCDQDGEFIKSLHGCAEDCAEPLAAYVREYQHEQYPSRNLMDYLDLYTEKMMEEGIKEKVSSAVPSLICEGGNIFCRIDLEMREDLDAEEFKAFIGNIRYQFTHGWGSFLEAEQIPFTDDTTLSVFLDGPGAYFLPEEQWHALLAGDKTVLGPKMSGLINAPRLYCCLRVDELEPDGTFRDYLTDAAGDHTECVIQAVRDFRTDTYRTDKLMDTLDLYTNKATEFDIKDKIGAAIPSIICHDNTLYLRVDLEMSEDLTAYELEVFQENLAYQFKWGWGNALSDQVIPFNKDTALMVVVEHDLGVLTEEEWMELYAIKDMSPSDLLGQIAQG